jgi:hypothetical protein
MTLAACCTERTDDISELIVESIELSLEAQPLDTQGEQVYLHISCGQVTLYRPSELYGLCIDIDRTTLVFLNLGERQLPHRPDDLVSACNPFTGYWVG